MTDRAIPVTSTTACCWGSKARCPSTNSASCASAASRPATPRPVAVNCASPCRPATAGGKRGRSRSTPIEHVAEAIRLVFRKFRELGSARQVFLWAREAVVKLPVVQRNLTLGRIAWRAPAYHSIRQILQNPIYAGAYAFGRRGDRTSVVEGRARKTSGHRRPMAAWNVLIRDPHPGYLTWAQFEEHQTMLRENAHMQKRAERKAARGGRALLTGLVRCGQCGRMMRVFYQPVDEVVVSSGRWVKGHSEDDQSWHGAVGDENHDESLGCAIAGREQDQNTPAARHGLFRGPGPDQQAHEQPEIVPGDM